MADAPDRDPDLDALFEAQRGPLFGLAYRMTGSADDADDVVQETFVRLLERPPDGARESLAPWLVRVATNLAIDALRRRRRRAYPGPWLPTPIECVDPERLAPARDSSRDPEARYGAAESATLAFLTALEALGPRQRAVLVLRDVLEYSAEEVAEFLGATAGSVRILHLRARRALDHYDRERCVPTPERQVRHRKALEAFLVCLVRQDVEGIERLLAESVRTVTDSAGEFTALAKPLIGRARVARFYRLAALERQTAGVQTEIRLVNGLPAAFVTLARPVRRQAPRSLLQVVLDESGRIRLVQVVLAPRKLAALWPA